MLSSPPKPRPRIRWPLVGRRVVGGSAAIWAGLWSAFAVATTWGEPWEAWLIAGGFAAALWAPVLAAWRWPLVGGLLLAGVGLWSMTFFEGRVAWIALSLPAVVLGAAFVWRGIWGRWRRARSRSARVA